MLAGIMRLVEQAQQSRSRAQALADRAAFWLTMVALGAGALTLVGWLAAGADVGVRRRAARHGARHRLPARAGARGAARHRDLDHAGRAERPPGARPARAGGSTTPQHGGLRQDRHAHAGRASGRRACARPASFPRRTRSDSPRRWSRTPSIPSRGPSWRAPRERGLDVPRGQRIRGHPRLRSSRHVSRGGRWPSAGRTCSADWASLLPAELVEFTEHGRRPGAGGDLSGRGQARSGRLRRGRRHPAGIGRGRPPAARAGDRGGDADRRRAGRGRRGRRAARHRDGLRPGAARGEGGQDPGAPAPRESGSRWWATA